MELPADFRADAGILEHESKLGIREDFFRDLLREDDWSFVIKLHALFEAACTHLLLFHFKEPELTDVFSRLELSNKTTGKIAFLGKMGLLGKRYRRLIANLSELRNSLVHDVRNTEFSLSAMVSTLSPAERKQFATAFSPFETLIRDFPYDSRMKIGFHANLQKQASIEEVTARLEADPKAHMWIGAYSALVSIVEMYGYSDYKQWIRAKGVFGADEDDPLSADEDDAL